MSVNNRFTGIYAIEGVNPAVDEVLIDAGNVTVTGNVTANAFSGNILAPGNVGEVLYNNATVVGAIPTLVYNGTNLVANMDMTISGNLTVDGDAIYANVTILNVEDPIIMMGRGPNGTPLTANDGMDRGTQMWYYTNQEYSAFIGWDNTANKLTAALQTTNTGEVVTVDNFGNIVMGNAEVLSVSSTGNITTDLDLIVGGNAAITGTTDITGNTTVTGTFDVTGNSTVTGTFDVTGNTTIAGTTDITGNTTVTGLFDVTGNSTIAGTVDVTGNTTVTGLFDVTGNSTITGTTDITGNTTVTGLFDVTGNSTVTGLFDVTGNTTVAGEVAITGNTAVTGNVDVTGNGSYSGDLAVTGNITGNAAGVTGINIFATIECPNPYDPQANVLANGISDTLVLNPAPQFVFLTDAANNTITLDEPIWTGGGNMGSITVTATYFYDFGLISAAANTTITYDLGPAGTAGGVTPDVFVLPNFTRATLPAVKFAGQMIFVTDATGGSVPAFSDGTNWYSVVDRSIIT